MPRFKTGVYRTPIFLLAAVLGACASAPDAPSAPEQDLLRPAQVQINKAEAAGAAELAPDSLREAHRRIGVAQDLIYTQAGRGQALNEIQREQLERLADQAEVDARLALAKTQQEAVNRKVKELRGISDAPARASQSRSGQSQADEQGADR